MQIDENGISLSTLTDILSADEANLQNQYGADFYIKPEGVIDNIAASTGLIELDFQAQIAFLTKQFDPETAEGNWQDALYERIGINRLAPEPTTLDLQISGIVGFEGSVGDITVRSSLTQEEFTNTETYTLDGDGLATVKFACVVAGETNIINTDTFQIVTAPTEVTGIVDDSLANIDIGRNRETDAEFRQRFRTSKGLNAKSSANAIIANLTKYVDDVSFLEVLDRKNDITIAAGNVEIIAHHNTTDEIFAETIFNTIADGIDTLGNTTVNLTDSEGQAVTIKFYSADEIEIDIEATIKLKTGYFQTTVFDNIKTSIMNYIENVHIYGLKSTIYATELIIPMLQVEGVEAVTAVAIKRSTDVNYSQSVTMTKYELPVFSAERITLNAAS